MDIKIVYAYNYSRIYVLSHEDEDLYYLINKDGTIEQVKKLKFPLDKIVEIPSEEIYSRLPEDEISHKQLDAILKLRTESQKEKIEKILSIKLEQHHHSNICFNDLDDNMRLAFYYSLYDKKTQTCEIEIFDYHLNFLEKSDKQIVVFVLEEFGTFYVNGKALNYYLKKYPSQKKKGKHFWSIHIDYETLIRVKEGGPFEYYSNDINYIKNFEELAPDLDNVVNLEKIRYAQKMFKEIRNKKSDYHVVEEKKTTAS